MSRKLIVGLSLIFLLVCVIAGTGWRALNHATDGFTEYRAIARDTILSGDLQSDMLMVRMNVKDYLITNSDKDKDQYNHYHQSALKHLEKAQQEVEIS